MNTKAQVEITDTFGGEANYSWVRRHEIDTEGKSEAQIKRAAKRAAEMVGVGGRWNSYGDMLEFRPYGACLVLFVTFPQ